MIRASDSRPMGGTAKEPEGGEGNSKFSRSEERPEFGVIAVYPDGECAARALQRLSDDGFDMRDVSMIGQGAAGSDVPAGVATASGLADTGAEVGAVAGGLLGLLFGTAFLVLPVLGPVLVSGSLTAALAGAAEGAAVGAVVGGLGLALISWGVPAEHAARFETHINEGKFLVLALGDRARIDRAKLVLAPEAINELDVYETQVGGLPVTAGAIPAERGASLSA